MGRERKGRSGKERKDSEIERKFHGKERLKKWKVRKDRIRKRKERGKVAERNFVLMIAERLNICLLKITLNHLKSIVETSSS